MSPPSLRHLSFASCLLLAIGLLTSPAVGQSDDILRELQPDAPAAKQKTAPPAPANPSPKTPADSDVDSGNAENQPAGAPTEEDTEAEEQPEDEREADEAAAGGGLLGWLDDVSRSGPLGLIREGGVFMYPILLLGVLAAGVIIERYRSLKLLDSDSTQLRSDVHDMLHADRVEEAFHLCDGSQGPVPAVLACGLRKYLVLQNLNYDAARTEEQVVKAMEDHSVHIVAALERHLPILATISSVAPMLGFLGTVAGMITSFKDIEAMFEGAGGGQNIVQAAAGGISVALITTCFGLIIGIPAFMAYNYFTGLINRFVLEVEESTTDLIEGVTLQLAVAGARADGRTVANTQAGTQAAPS